jgi:hypothetical protein
MGFEAKTFQELEIEVHRYNFCGKYGEIEGSGLKKTNCRDQGLRFNTCWFIRIPLLSP